MQEKVDEPIEVEVVFLRSKVIPRSFSVRGQVYRVKSIGLVHHSFRGREKIYYFSVTDGATFFRLAFFAESLQWKLEEIYAE